MNRELRYKFNHLRFIKEIEDSRVESVVSDDDFFVSSKPEDSLLSLVYAPDKLSNLPTGDLCYLVNDKANPQVKDFILKNLQFDVSSAALPAVPDGIDDDLAFDLTRRSGESVNDYAERLNSFVSQNRNIVNILGGKDESSVSGVDASLANE